MAMADDTRTSLGLLVLRLVFGGTMVLQHGWGKFASFGARAAVFSDPLGVGHTASLSLAVFAELVCATLLAVGLLTRWAAVPLMITFAVAFFVVHGGDPFGKRELAFLYLAAYGTIFIMGPGRYALDTWLQPRVKLLRSG